ncbi:Uma2 family endonuclease [Oscillatoria sp. FACHB-1407]|uniref:Uma2 family endonuclease n=1 Tax=Oscillatoria sp. FACHB-1407 TaxID=2692847 RepID=UPI0016842D28|nr:Uma2 family endonuclease [Oscillatoria sp. FACHB-1407]MBD2459915.1 Uma2 family endonuclease [Oscillatoria sp. FACHB-1407]
MSQPATERVYWTIADLDLLPDNGTRYEIIDGELFMTRAPHWKHQKVADNICAALNRWSDETKLGEATTTPGIIFSEADNVIPDVVWASYERLAVLLDEAGHLTEAPELIVEVMSPGADNERRDSEVKLKLYASQGVQEYWIVNRRLQQIQVYRRQQATLKLVTTLMLTDDITSPLLPGFGCSVASFFRSELPAS